MDHVEPGVRVAFENQARAEGLDAGHEPARTVDPRQPQDVRVLDPGLQPQLGVEADPVRVELFPEPGAINGSMDDGKEALLEWRGQEPPSRARVARADPLVRHPESTPRNRLVSTHDEHRARAHVLLLQDHPSHAVAPVVVERFARMLEETGLPARLGR